MLLTSEKRNVAKSTPPLPPLLVPCQLKCIWPVRLASEGTRRLVACRKSAPNLNWWLPKIFVQLLTNCSPCSFSISGQLQRVILRASPRFPNPPPPPPTASKNNPGNPFVVTSEVFKPGNPNAEAASVLLWSNPVERG